MAVSNELYTQARDVIDGANKVLICVNNRSTFDTHLAAAALYKYIVAERKNASLCVNGELILRHKQMFEDNDIAIEEDLKPMNYVIAIDHSEGGIEKVSYDDKDGKFYLYVTPVKDAKPFDFDKVEFSQGGGGADAIVVFGARTLRWMNDLYNDNQDLFDNAQIVNINNIPGDQEFGKVQLVDTEASVSGMVYEMLKGMSSSSASAVSGLLLTGVLDHLQLLQRSDYKISEVEHVAGLVKAGADLKESIATLYFDKTLENFEVQRRVINNVKMDSQAEVIWSSVSHFDLGQCGVNRENFVLDGRIIFNISKAFSIAFVLYEVAEGEVLVELESNSPEINAKEILEGIKASGNAGRVFFTIRDKTLAEVEQEIMEMVSAAVKVDTISVVGPEGQEDGETSKKDRDKGTLLTPENFEDEEEPEEAAKSEAPPVMEAQDEKGMVTPPPVTPE